MEVPTGQYHADQLEAELAKAKLRGALGVLKWFAGLVGILAPVALGWYLTREPPPPVAVPEPCAWYEWGCD